MRPIQVFPIKSVNDVENIAAAFNEVQSSEHVRLLFLARDEHVEKNILILLKDLCGVVSDKARGFDALLANARKERGILCYQIINLCCKAAEEKKS